MEYKVRSNALKAFVSNIYRTFSLSQGIAFPGGVETGARYEPLTRRSKVKGQTDEAIICKNSEEKYCDIEATIDYWFWFRQRILKYGKNARILSPEKFADEIEKEYREIRERLGKGNW